MVKLGLFSSSTKGEKLGDYGEENEGSGTKKSFFGKSSSKPVSPPAPPPPERSGFFGGGKNDEDSIEEERPATTNNARARAKQTDRELMGRLERSSSRRMSGDLTKGSSRRQNSSEGRRNSSVPKQRSSSRSKSQSRSTRSPPTEENGVPKALEPRRRERSSGHRSSSASKTRPESDKPTTADSASASRSSSRKKRGSRGRADMHASMPAITSYVDSDGFVSGLSTPSQTPSPGTMSRKKYGKDTSRVGKSMHMSLANFEAKPDDFRQIARRLKNDESSDKQDATYDSDDDDESWRVPKPDKGLSKEERKEQIKVSKMEKIKELQRENRKLQDKMKEKKSRRSELSGKVIQADGTDEDYSVAYSTGTGNTRGNQMEALKALSKTAVSQRRIVDTQAKDMEKFQKEIRKMKSEMASSEKRYKQQRTETLRLTKRVEANNMEIESLQIELSRAIEKAEKAEADETLYKTKLQRLTKQLNQSEARSERRSGARSESEQLSDLEKDLEERDDELVKVREELNETYSRVQKLENEVTTSNDYLEHARAERVDMRRGTEEEKEKLKEKLEKTQMELKRFKEDSDELQMTKVDSVQQRSITQEKVVKLEKRNKELKARWAASEEKKTAQLKEAKSAADAAAFAMERMRAELEAVKMHNMRNTQDGDSNGGSGGQPLGDDILQEELQRVERENMAYQKRVRDLESGGLGPMDELRNELKVAQRQSRIFEETANDFKGSNVELTARVAELEKEQSGSGRATEDVERLHNEMETLEREKKLLEEKSSELEKRNFGLQTTVTTLIDENNQNSDAVMAVEEKKSMLEDMQADAAQRNKFLESKVVDLEEKVAWHVEEVESLEKKLELKEQAQAILVEQNEELESNVAQLNEDVGSWRAKASDASVAAASASSRSAAGSVQEDERFKKLQKEKSEMEKRNSVLESHVKSLEKDKSHWNKNVLEPVQTQNEFLEERNAKVEQRNNALEQKLADLESATNALSSKELETNHQQRVLEDKINQLEKQNHTLDSNVKRLEEEVVTWTSTAELAKKQTQLNTLGDASQKEEIARVRAQLDKILEEKDTLREKKNKLEQQNVSLRAKLAQAGGVDDDESESEYSSGEDTLDDSNQQSHILAAMQRKKEREEEAGGLRGWWTANRATANLPEDAKEQIREKDLRIDNLDRTVKANEQTIQRLRSDLVRINSSFKEEEYVSKMKLTRVLQENTAMTIKVAALENVIEANSGDTPSRDGPSAPEKPKRPEPSPTQAQSRSSSVSRGAKKTSVIAPSREWGESTNYYEKIKYLEGEVEKLEEEKKKLQERVETLSSDLVKEKKQRDDSSYQTDYHTDDGASDRHSSRREASEEELRDKIRRLQDENNELHDDMVRRIAEMDEERGYVEDDYEMKLQARDATITSLELSLNQLKNSRLNSGKKTDKAPKGGFADELKAKAEHLAHVSVVDDKKHRQAVISLAKRLKMQDAVTEFINPDSGEVDEVSWEEIDGIFAKIEEKFFFLEKVKQLACEFVMGSEENTTNEQLIQGLKRKLAGEDESNGEKLAKQLATVANIHVEAGQQVEQAAAIWNRIDEGVEDGEEGNVLEEAVAAVVKQAALVQNEVVLSLQLIELKLMNRLENKNTNEIVLKRTDGSKAKRESERELVSLLGETDIRLNEKIDQLIYETKELETLANDASKASSIYGSFSFDSAKSKKSNTSEF
eukprot:CAMPEP_0198291210 /NCGR_PEP_ID=MMETSP1449-20131203/8814_1 /TAXON_ID=420275 /ORGANISM="Attheya septentrionalis, Strain CCMP2084" /LENGTH=1698 /DNA_ID=CAMNT_0043989817 /DNA_START=316 /DNA_END=5412 /DNA_ORIENTATION=+